MPRHRHAVLPLAFSTLAACGATGSGSNAAGHVPAAPAFVTAIAEPERITLTWTPVAGARSYTVYWANASGAGTRSGTPVANVAPPFQHTGLAAGRSYSYVVTATNDAGEGPASDEVTASPHGARASFGPAWRHVAPSRTLVHAYDPARSEADNGALLRNAILRLQPGDHLEIAAGRYSVAARLGLQLQGTAAAPITVAAAAGATVVLTRPDTSQNTVNIDFGRYLALRGIEITGGDTALKLYDCSQVWIDGCHIHHCNGVAVAANSAPTDHLFLTRNEIHDTGGSGGEGMYLGANNGQFVTHHSVIAQNHVHRCGGTQGDGIEIKQGSYANHVVENEVHDTNYPCILLYGTGGNEPNVVERNVCYRSNDNVLQVQGEAIVRNNALFGGSIGFASHDHQGPSRNLVFVHNTILTRGRGADLAAWNGRPGMVFANNVVYSERGDALRCNGSAGVTMSGNVVLGSTSGTTAFFLSGIGLADFDGASFDGSARDVRPSSTSPILGTGDPAFALPDDLTGAARSAPFEAGCRER